MFAGAGNVASGIAEKLNFSWPWNESSLTRLIQIARVKSVTEDGGTSAPFPLSMKFCN